jgi:hypothetical protein
MRKLLLTVGAIFVAVMFAISTTPNASAQGRGHGAGGGGGAAPGGPPGGMGVGRGIGTSGRADTGRETASERSNDRARMAGENMKAADNDLANHPKVASDMHLTANDLRAGYKAALATNPNLKFGQFVAATRLAQNLGRRNPAITRDAILAGLAKGDSIGKTLQKLGLSKDQAKAAEKQADMQIKESKRKS